MKTALIAPRPLDVLDLPADLDGRDGTNRARGHSQIAARDDLNAVRANGRLLYDWLIRPFEGHLDPNRTLVIETDGNLSAVPFQALVEPDGSYLGSHVSMSFVPGLSYMLGLRPSGAIVPGTAALLVGNPAVYDPLSGLIALPDAGTEAKRISQLFSDSVLLEGLDATPGTIRAHLGDAVLFHFAGHAVSATDRTGLELAPDNDSDKTAGRTLFTPERIATSNLSRLQLVVLSACSTGRAGEEGLNDPEDIAAAFLRSRVPHVIASRWVVDSASTSDLMDTFYRALLKGESVSEALRSASAQVGKGSRAHPYYWAAFSVFGRA